MATFKPLIADSLCVAYGKADVLNSVHVEINPGEITCLLGSNGAGKSSTLRTISGLVKPSGGKITFQGEDITGKDPTQIATEVFFLPCCTSIEKEGSIANSGRWMQWRYAGPDRYGETKPDGDIMVEMMLAIRKLYKEQGGVFPEPILGLGIDKWMEGHEFSPANTAKVMNGYFLRDVTIGGKLYKRNRD